MEEELQIENNQGGGTKIRTITSRFWLFWKLLYVFSSSCNPDSKLIVLGYLSVLDLILIDLQKKIFRCPDHPNALTSHGLNCKQV